MSNTVIIGAGIIGCSTAYYLSESTRTLAQSIHLVEAAPELFKCASGLAGGILAEDWFAPSAAELGALSFKLHRTLAESHNGRERWGYSKSTATTLNQNDQAVIGRSGTDWVRDGESRASAAGTSTFAQGEGPAWFIEKEGRSLEVVSKEGTFAQLDPRRLCEFLLEQCIERGAVLHQPGKVVSVSKDARDQLAAVRIVADDGTETDIPCTRLVITAGPWTPKVFSSLFPSSPISIPVTPLAGHSLILKSPRWTKELEEKGCHAVFAVDPIKGFAPEMASRIGGEIFLGGLNSSTIPLPALPTDAVIQADSIEQLKETAVDLFRISSGIDDLEIVREALCFRPVTPNGQAIVSRIPDIQLGGGFSTRGGREGGVFTAAGHGPWGISQSLGTGKVLSELLEGQPTSANIDALALRVELDIES